MEMAGFEAMILRFAREGIPPSEFKLLTMREIARLRGIMTGETTARRHERGDYS